jgi:hypothetical protein
MTQKLLIGLLLVLAIYLLVAKSVWGNRSDMRTSTLVDLPAATIDDLRAWLMPPIAASEITVQGGRNRDCRVEPTRLLIPQDATCRFTIPVTPDETRRLRLVLTTGQSLTLTLEQEGVVPSEVTLQQADEANTFDLYVYKADGGGVATLEIAECQADEADATNPQGDAAAPDQANAPAPSACRLMME